MSSLEPSLPVGINPTNAHHEGRRASRRASCCPGVLPPDGHAFQRVKAPPLLGAAPSLLSDERTQPRALHVLRELMAPTYASSPRLSLNDTLEVCTSLSHWRGPTNNPSAPPSHPAVPSPWLLSAQSHVAPATLVGTTGHHLPRVHMDRGRGRKMLAPRPEYLVVEEGLISSGGAGVLGSPSPPPRCS